MRNGYLAALYCLQADSLPGGYERSVDVARIQEAVYRAIWLLRSTDPVTEAVVDGLADDLGL